ncbi:MAG: molybdopterin-binding protein [Actinomycetota bacterium]
MDASIVVVGDEILSGHVRDANAHVIATRLAEHGHVLRRVTIVPDEPEDIAECLRRDLADDSIGIIFTCGGLGPTHDDRTMDGIALALGVNLEECAPIATRIAKIIDSVSSRGFDGDPLGAEGLRKMALAPAGSEALVCASGVIPAVTLLVGETRIVVLPGPPRELETVFRETVEQRFLVGTGAAVFREEIEHTFPESSLADALSRAEERFPGAKIGSYPLADRVLIRVAGPHDMVEEASAFVREAIDALAASEDGRRLSKMMKDAHPHQ